MKQHLVVFQGVTRVAKFSRTGNVVITPRVGSNEPSYLLSGYRLEHAYRSGELALAVYA